ncbi:unnamed protein product [Sphagnum troendelagicum]|uniref:Uncharacterized protein n=1 Tax=Sphagnum troendelagicum TaxID=128251 RepID=A0ABP0TMM7_9BRYO
MIRKARRNARQGFGKFKCKPNPSGDNARFPTLTSNEDPPFTNESFAPPVQRSHVTPSTPSSPLPSRGTYLVKKRRMRSEHRRTRPLSATQRDVFYQTRSRKQSRQGVMEERMKGHPQRSPPTITHPNISM